MRYNLVHSMLCGLVLAGIIHIIIIVLVPYLGNKDAANRLLSQNADNRFITATSSNKPLLPNADPYFATASCSFDITNAGISVTGKTTDQFWSVAIYSDDGRVIYSLNTRAAIGNTLNMIIAGPVQLAQLRQFQPDLLEAAIVVESRLNAGFVLVRALDHDPSLKPDVQEFMNSLACEPVESDPQGS